MVEEAQASGYLKAPWVRRRCFAFGIISRVAVRDWRQRPPKCCNVLMIVRPDLTVWPWNRPGPIRH